MKLLHTYLPTLRRKVAAAVFLMMTIGGLSFTYVAHQTGFTMLEKQLQMKAQNITRIYAGVLEHEMLEGKSSHRQHLRDAIQYAVLSHDIVDIFILRNDGTEYVRVQQKDSTSTYLPQQFFKTKENSKEKMFTVEEHDAYFVYVVSPIMNKPECFSCHRSIETVRGYLGVKVAVDDVRSVALEHRTMNVLMTLLTFFGIGGILYLSLSVLAINPLHKLHSYIRSVESGIEELKHGEKVMLPLLPETFDVSEINNLARDFNNLIARLNDVNAELFELHQQQLEHANRLATTGEIAASIAHEIKNPVAGVLGALDVFFKKELVHDEPKKEIIVEMMTQLERVNRAVNDLLSYARPTSPVVEKIQANECIEKTLSMLAQQLREKNISIRKSFAEEHTYIVADKQQFQQVLWNVILNALQAMENGGTLSIRSTVGNAAVLFSVSDTGNGIARELLENVFKPFYSTKSKGTGLGMTITKRIVELHGGTISLASEIGKGTTVTITFPQNFSNVQDAR
jgi:signal transduction histidine kinase